MYNNHYYSQRNTGGTTEAEDVMNRVVFAAVEEISLFSFDKSLSVSRKVSIPGSKVVSK